MNFHSDKLGVYAIFILSLCGVTLAPYFIANAQSSEGIVVFDLAVSNDTTKDNDFQITATIRNGGSSEAAAFYLVQVKDPADQVVVITPSEFVLKAGESRQVTTPWKADGGGVYTVQIFGWHDIESPLNFSYLDGEQTIENDLNERCIGSATCMKATVNGITDGDTLTIGGATVRLALVDTPERGERGYTEATSFTSRMCPVGSEAIIDEDDGQTEGSYGRMIAKVYCIGGMINQKLLDFHHAVILLRHCEESEFGQDLWATKNGCAIA